MNDLTVLGICTYHPAIHRWLRSLRTHFDGPCQLHLVNGAISVREGLAQLYGCEVIDVPAKPDFWADPPPGRFCRMWAYLASVCLERVLTP
jgi:hypothetical protein